jgi:hypothetical protein
MILFTFENGCNIDADEIVASPGQPGNFAVHGIGNRKQWLHSYLKGFRQILGEHLTIGYIGNRYSGHIPV